MVDNITISDDYNLSIVYPQFQDFYENVYLKGAEVEGISLIPDEPQNDVYFQKATAQVDSYFENIVTSIGWEKIPMTIIENAGEESESKRPSLGWFHLMATAEQVAYMSKVDVLWERAFTISAQSGGIDASLPATRPSANIDRLCQDAITYIKSSGISTDDVINFINGNDATGGVIVYDSIFKDGYRVSKEEWGPVLEAIERLEGLVAVIATSTDEVVDKSLYDLDTLTVVLNFINNEQQIQNIEIAEIANLLALLLTENESTIFDNPYPDQDVIAPPLVRTIVPFTDAVEDELIITGGWAQLSTFTKKIIFKGSMDNIVGLGNNQNCEFYLRIKRIDDTSFEDVLFAVITGRVGDTEAEISVDATRDQILAYFGITDPNFDLGLLEIAIFVEPETQITITQGDPAPEVDGIIITLITGESLSTGLLSALGISYDNTTSGLFSTNVQDAIDEINTSTLHINYGLLSGLTILAAKPTNYLTPLGVDLSTIGVYVGLTSKNNSGTNFAGVSVYYSGGVLRRVIASYNIVTEILTIGMSAINSNAGASVPLPNNNNTVINWLVRGI